MGETGGRGGYFLQGSQGISIISALCGNDEMIRFYYSYLWFDHKTIKVHQDEKVNNVSDNTCPGDSIKYGKK